MGPFMPGTWSRSLLLLTALGLVSACEEPAPPPEKAPVVAPVKKPVAAKPVAAKPVVKKPAPVVIDFGGDGGGGGGWN